MIRITIVMDDSFASIILSTNNSLDEQQEDDILSLGGEDSCYRDCRWETTAAEVTKNTSLVPPCRCPPKPSSKTTIPKMPKRKISKAAIRNWMLQIQMPTTDGSGHTFSKKNVANIVKEAEELVRTLLLVDSPDTSTITPVVVLNTVRINEIASKSA
jgi:hypothetical protein